MSSNKLNVTIVGAGPAGLSAAIQLARFDVPSTIVDENPAIGGAIFKQPDKGLNKSFFRDEKTFVKARKLFNEFESHRNNISLQLGTEVLGDLPLTNELVVLQNGQVKKKPIKPLILCTGCYERAQPFPGWTTAGIMSVGGIQLQAKCGNIKPGQRAALVGTGPLLLVAAKQLHMAGVEVVGVVEAGKRMDIAKNMFSLFANSKLLREGISIINYLKKQKIPIYYGHGILAAKGKHGLEKLEVAPYDKEWKPIKEKAFSLNVDCAGIGYGYVPRIQLTQMLKCQHEFNPAAGGYFPIVDKWQRSTVEGIYTAGDNSGVYGSDVAINEGKIAALGYLLDINKISLEEALKLAAPIQNNIRKLKKFQSAFHDFSKLKSGLMDLPEADTIICRCEHVKKQAIDDAIEAGVENMMALKIRTRVGMGDCQGKMCGSFCSEYLASKLNRSHEDVGFLKPRFPLAPLPFNSLSQKELQHAE